MNAPVCLNELLEGCTELRRCAAAGECLADTANGCANARMCANARYSADQRIRAHMGAGVRECARSYAQGCGERARAYTGAALAHNRADAADAGVLR